MRIVAAALLAAFLAPPAHASFAWQDRSLTCKPLAELGRAWSECCTQSYARQPSRAMSRRARMRNIERCVRTKLRT